MNTITKNNYDNSSTMSDCELRCFFDTELGRIYFDNEFFLIQGSSNHSPLVLFYNNGGTPDSVSSYINFDEVTQKEARNFIFKNVKKLKTALALAREIRDNYSNDWKEYAKEYIDENYSLAECGQEKEFPQIGETKLETIKINGYNQGDCAFIIYKPEGFLSDFSSAKQEFTKLVYDCPIICSLEVNKNEYMLTEGLKDEYTWDKDAILSYAKKGLKLEKAVLEWLTENLPEYPDYL